MSDRAMTARAALESVVRPGRHGSLVGEPGVIISERTGLGIASVMARKGLAHAVSETAAISFGAALPLTPRREEGRGIAFIWAGPERWLAIAPRRASEDLADTLAGAFSGLASVAAQGDGRAVIRIAGPRARDVLAKGLPIDLHERAFKPGDTAVTGAAHIELHIWQLDDSPSYELSVFRGFAQSFWQWLTQSAAEYGYQIEAAV